MQQQPYPFSPPQWCEGLKNIPKERLKLSQRPTAIHELLLPEGFPNGFAVCIKRDDMTGAANSGNKVRKLDFLLADALAKGCDCVITVGGIQSNHVRATAIAAREVGLECHLILVPPNKMEPEDVPVTSNVLLDRLAGAHIYLENELMGSRFEEFDRMLGKVEEKLRSENKKPYIIHVGGTGVVSLWSYIEAFQEMIEQGILENFDDVFVGVSTGGTACGLGVGNYLNGSKLKIHAVLVFNTAQMMYDQMNTELRELGLCDKSGKPVPAEDLVEIVDGYADLTQQAIDMVHSTASSTGIIFDTTFTVKVFRGMMCEMEKNPDRFKGRRVLFIHTGGLYGITSDEALKQTLLQKEKDVIKLSDVI